MKNEYIEQIDNLLPLADLELLDFIFQLLDKSVEKPVISVKEHQQFA
jgi:hypothetical protein